MNRLTYIGALFLFIVGGLFASAQASPQVDDLSNRIDQAVRYLHKAQVRGCWKDDDEITAKVLHSIQGTYRQYSSLDGPMVRLPLEYLLAKQNKNGALKTIRTPLKKEILITSAVISGYSQSRTGVYDDKMKLAKNYLTSLKPMKVKKGSEAKGLGLSSWFEVLGALVAMDLKPSKKLRAFVESCQKKDGTFLEFPVKVKQPSSQGHKSILALKGISALIMCGTDLESDSFNLSLSWLMSSTAEILNLKKDELQDYERVLLFTLSLTLLEERGVVIHDGRVKNWAERVEKGLLQKQSTDGHWGQTDSIEKTACALKVMNLLYKRESS